MLTLNKQVWKRQKDEGRSHADEGRSKVCLFLPPPLNRRLMERVKNGRPYTGAWLALGSMFHCCDLQRKRERDGCEREEEEVLAQHCEGGRKEDKKGGQGRVGETWWIHMFRSEKTYCPQLTADRIFLFIGMSLNVALLVLLDVINCCIAVRQRHCRNIYYHFNMFLNNHCKWDIEITKRKILRHPGILKIEKPPACVCLCVNCWEMVIGH